MRTYPKQSLGKGRWTQCELRRGNVSQVAWIESLLAVVGGSVKVDGEVWEVVATYHTRVEGCDVSHS